MPIQSVKLKENARLGGLARGRKDRQWRDIGAYMETVGSDRFLKEIHKLEGIEFCNTFLRTLEYFKEKKGREPEDQNKLGDMTVNILQFNIQKKDELSGSGWDQLTALTPKVVSSGGV